MMRDGGSSSPWRRPPHSRHDTDPETSAGRCVLMKWTQIPLSGKEPSHRRHWVKSRSVFPLSLFLFLFIPAGSMPTVHAREFSPWAENTCAFHAEHPSIITSWLPPPGCESSRQAWQGKGLEKMLLAGPSRTWPLRCLPERISPQKGHNIVFRGVGSVRKVGALARPWASSTWLLQDEGVVIK